MSNMEGFLEINTQKVDINTGKVLVFLKSNEGIGYSILCLHSGLFEITENILTVI